MMAQVIIDNIEDSAIVSAEIRPTGEEYPAVSFTLDEERDTILILVDNGVEDVTSLEVPAEAFWAATVALTRDNLTKELEQLVK